MSLLDRFKSGLIRSREGFTRRLDLLFRSGNITEEFFAELEEALIAGDVGAETSLKLVEQIRLEAARTRLIETAAVRNLLAEKLTGILSIAPVAPAHYEPPLVILLVGVNGAGKTTTAAKLAHLYREQGEKVLLVAGDTFRAAAIDQLQIWADRAGVDLIRQQPGADPSAVFYDAIGAARARQVGVVIGDTAGRLHTKVNLMEELKKIYRVIGRLHHAAPQQVLLVLDAVTGQNGIAQAARFHQTVPVNGVILTKLDGTARGGIVVAVSDTLKIPVLYVGIGEKMDDLAAFDASVFVQALLS